MEADNAVGKMIASCQGQTLCNIIVSEQCTIICCVDVGGFGNESVQLLRLSHGVRLVLVHEN